jgi:hypothetical protein
MTYCLKASSATLKASLILSLSMRNFPMVGSTGIEPVSKDYRSFVLPTELTPHGGLDANRTRVRMIFSNDVDVRKKQLLGVSTTGCCGNYLGCVCVIVGS